MKEKVRQYLAFFRSVPNLRTKLWLCGCNTFVLLFIVLSLQYTTYVRSDETAFYKWFAVLQHNVFLMDRKPLRDSLVFLDVSKDIQIVEDTFPNYGKLVLSDRHLLADFFKEASRDSTRYKFIICDITFEYPSPDDSLLKEAIEKTKKLIVARGSSPRGSLFNTESASVEYTVANKAFVKMPLFDQQGMMTLPARLMEMTSSRRYTYDHEFTFEDDVLAFRTVTPNFYYRPRDLTAEGKVSRYYLGQIMKDPRYFERFLENKYIVLGDLSNDMHSTYLGQAPGPLILLNTYLTLRERSMKLSIAWLITLFMIFLIISYFIFMHPDRKLEQLSEKAKYHFVKNLIKKYISYLGIMIVAEIFSFVIFGIFISLFYTATYLTLLETFLKERKKYLRSRKMFTYLKEEVL